MTYQINVQSSGNALSAFTSYNFETVGLAMTLIDSKTKNIVALEKTSSLEDVSSAGQEFSLDNDMITYIEVPKIEAGLYELQIHVMKSLFLPTHKFATCLNFDLTVEYVSRQIYQDDSPLYEVTRIFPTESTLVKDKSQRMAVKFN